MGTAIPVAAQMFAVVDVYDALTSERSYRSAWTRDQALAHIAAGRGTHFTPDVVDAFLNLPAPGRLAPEGSLPRLPSRHVDPRADEGSR